MQQARFEYHVVAVDKTMDLQPTLTDWAEKGWKYVGDYQSSGYTVRLIFERPLFLPSALPRA